MYVLFVLLIVSLFLFIRNISNYFTRADITRKKENLLNEMVHGQSKSKDLDAKKTIDNITNPFLKIVPKFIIRMYSKDIIASRIKMAKWDKYMNPSQYIIMDLMLKIIGVVMFCLFSTESVIMGVIFLIPLCTVLPVGLKGEADKHRERLFAEFPDFIRITQGYLVAKVPLIEAVTQSIQYVGKEWKPLLKQFVVTTETINTQAALQELAENVDVFEIKELLSLISVNLEQGIEVEEAFTRQLDKIKAMQDLILDKSIMNRQTMATALNGPLLLAVIFTFALPIIYDFMTLGLF